MCSNPLSDPGLPAPWPPLARARNAVMDSGARPWWGQSGGVPGCAPGGPTTFAYIERIFFQYARHIRHADFWFAVIRPLLALPGPPARISYVPLASPDLGAPACQRAISLPNEMHTDVVAPTDRLVFSVRLASDDHGSCEFSPRADCFFFRHYVNHFCHLDISGELFALGSVPRTNKQTLIDAGIGRFAVCRWCFLPQHPLPYRLSVQAAKGPVPDEDLPPEHQRKWQHLLRHPA